MKVAIIGGGAAGFFSAIAVKTNYPDASVVIFEKTQKLLAKVKVSGGGRCNLTNGCPSIKALSTGYPRGEKSLKKAFQIFNNKHIMEWFESRNVPLIIESDNRVFPATQNSQTIIDCFLQETKRLGIEVMLNTGIKTINPKGNQLELSFTTTDTPPQIFDKVIVASGGSPKREGLAWLESMNHKIEDPIPSLFTFNMPTESVKELMGIVVEKTRVNIQGAKIKSEGSLLITHWGMSGPAILKLSAFGARQLHEMGYNFSIQINWINESNHEIAKQQLTEIIQEHSNKMLSTIRPYNLPERLWLFLLQKSNLSRNKKWSELGKKGLNKLVRVLTNDDYAVKGKTTFKEEFVTCGGVSLESINMNTMESKVCENLYFAGEIMDIDGITGGYNFQAAWTTAYIAGKLN